MNRLLTTVSVLGLSAGGGGPMEVDSQRAYAVTQIYSTTEMNIKAQRLYAVTE